jgi:hypothetical protein
MTTPSRHYGATFHIYAHSGKLVTYITMFLAVHGKFLIFASVARRVTNTTP